MDARELLRTHLPTGGELPLEEWERRHSSLTRMLWVTAAILAVFSYLSGYHDAHALLHVAALLPLALAATSRKLSRQLRTVICSLGLLTGAALGVHIAGGVIEAHFAFFVVVVLLTVYEDWIVFALAVGYVLVHHGVLGMFAANQVFAEPDQYAHPWKWAAIHAIFVAAAGVAGLITWRLNEDVRREMRRTQEQLHTASVTDVLTELGNRRRLLGDLDEAMTVPGMTLSTWTDSRSTTTRSAIRPATRCSPASDAGFPMWSPTQAWHIAWVAMSSASSSRGRTQTLRMLPRSRR